MASPPLDTDALDRGPTVALVPLRSPGAGKTRLSSSLDVAERASLSGAMLADVTSALRGARGVDRVVVAASGPAAAAAASALALEVLIDPPTSRSLDDAVAAARRSLGAIGGLLVVTADLPRLAIEDVEQLLNVDAPVAVAPTDDGGTGGLLRRPPDVVGTAYGPGSAAAHRALAEARGVPAEIVDAVGFRHDVDTWADLVALTSGRVGDATAAFLSTIGSRLDAAG